MHVTSAVGAFTLGLIRFGNHLLSLACFGGLAYFFRQSPGNFCLVSGKVKRSSSQSAARGGQGGTHMQTFSGAKIRTEFLGLFTAANGAAQGIVGRALRFAFCISEMFTGTVEED